jgi:BclB C-terminal domain-containing protein
MAFSMPRDGVITSLSAFYSTAAAVSLVGTTITISAQLYSSTTPDDNFTAIPGAIVNLSPDLTGAVAIGEVLSGTTSGLTIPVTAGTRLLLVFTATVTAGIDVATVITGYASAGLGIE